MSKLDEKLNELKDKKAASKITKGEDVSVDPSGALNVVGYMSEEPTEMQQNPMPVDVSFDKKQPLKPLFDEFRQTAQTVTPPQPQEPQKEEDSGMSKYMTSDLIAGATPALMSLLFGDTELGFGMSGKYMLQENEKKKQLERNLAQARLKGDLELQQKIKEMEMKRQGKLAEPLKANMVVDATDEYGNRVGFVPYDVAVEKGLRKYERNPISDYWATKGAVARENIASKEEMKRLGLKEKEYGKLVNFRKEFLKDDLVDSNLARLNATNDAIKVLSSKNPLGDAGAVTLFAKGIFGEVGNLAAQEQSRFQGSPAFLERYNTLLSKFKNGLIGEGDRAELIRLAKDMRSFALKNLDKRKSDFLKSQGAISDLNFKDVIDPLIQSSMAEVPKVRMRVSGRGEKMVPWDQVKTMMDEYGAQIVGE